ncbi:MAG: hypothetical protein JSS66_09715 [Armatimonadetes bacterium]|nr:hypothetical protein [Armatimonadota bacterium]
MTPGFSPDQLAAATRLWNLCYPDRFHVDESIVRFRTNCCPIVLWEGSTFHDRAALVLKGSGSPTLFDGQDPSRCYVSLLAFTDKDVAIGLLKDALSFAQSKGFRKVAFGMDPDHFLPGCPTECSELAALLHSVGFVEGSECFDLERDLAGFEPNRFGTRQLRRERAGVRRCKPSEVPALERFLRTEFPGRWHHDVMRKAVDQGEADDVFLLWADDEVGGFAMTQREGCKQPVAGATWHLSLGSSWGALGPIGIGKSLRGRGLGNGLLGKSLEALRDRGARQTIIDWTVLDQFYGAHGFEITRRYTSLVLEL